LCCGRYPDRRDGTAAHSWPSTSSRALQQLPQFVIEIAQPQRFLCQAVQFFVASPIAGSTLLAEQQGERTAILVAFCFELGDALAKASGFIQFAARSRGVVISLGHRSLGLSKKPGF